MTDTTLTVRLSVETKAQLERLAGVTNQEQSLIGAEAISLYVDRELSTIEAIERACDDFHEGRVVSHDVAIGNIRAKIEATKAAR